MFFLLGRAVEYDSKGVGWAQPVAGLRGSAAASGTEALHRRMYCTAQPYLWPEGGCLVVTHSLLSHDNSGSTPHRVCSHPYCHYLPQQRRENNSNIPGVQYRGRCLIVQRQYNKWTQWNLLHVPRFHEIVNTVPWHCVSMVQAIADKAAYLGRS